MSAKDVDLYETPVHLSATAPRRPYQAPAIRTSPRAALSESRSSLRLTPEDVDRILDQSAAQKDDLHRYLRGQFQHSPRARGMKLR